MIDRLDRDTLSHVMSFCVTCKLTKIAPLCKFTRDVAYEALNVVHVRAPSSDSPMAFEFTDHITCCGSSVREAVDAIPPLKRAKVDFTNTPQWWSQVPPAVLRVRF